MIRKRILWIAVLVALTAIAGCGGKKATETPPPVEPTPTQTETVQEDIPAPTPDPVAPEQLDPSAISDVYFDFDSYSLSSEAKSTLEANAREWRSRCSVTIEGCDERGTGVQPCARREARMRPRSSLSRWA
jgi:outer membrane protein OmpA-like peptidoglycan-associated protein